MKRRTFIKNGLTIGTGLGILPMTSFSAMHDFTSNRPPKSKRQFTSQTIEESLKAFSSKVKHRELVWLFENCFPNTLDTTVDFEWVDGKPDTYVITGDIDAMWLRDSSAQVFPYLEFCAQDKDLRDLIAGVIHRQMKFIHLDPYANAFYKDEKRVSQWKKSDMTNMKPGVHERKWEIDSLCYPIRLSYHYWKVTSDTKPFDHQWLEGIRLIHKTFVEQQRKDHHGPYSFQRETAWATDGVPLAGYGYPVKPNGLIASMFRPSDDATIFPYLIPSNYFAVVSLNQAAEMVDAIFSDHSLAEACKSLATEVASALKQNAVVRHPNFGDILAYEVNGFGSYNLMDDANVPSLLSLPYLNAFSPNNAIYLNTRKFVLSQENPFYFAGKAASGVGGPHAGMYMIWPLSIIMQALTSKDPNEIRQCLISLTKNHGGTGFMHESFHMDDPNNFTRKWFAWANTLFGELVWKTFKSNPQLLEF